MAHGKGNLALRLGGEKLADRGPAWRRRVSETISRPDRQPLATSVTARLARHLQNLTPPDMAAVSDRAGVPRKIGARARAGRKVGAMAYMLLCSTAGVDAAMGAPIKSAPCAGSAIVWWLFGCNLFITRRLRRLDLRCAAALAGVSAATLSRAEHGKPISIESFLGASTFIRLPPESFLCFTANINCNTLKKKESPEVHLGYLLNEGFR